MFKIIDGSLILNVNAENRKQLSVPEKLPGLSRNRPLEPRYIGWSRIVGKLSEDIIVGRVKYEETRAAPKIPRFQASHQLLTANFKMATKGESDWMRDCTSTRDKISEGSGYEISPRKRTKVVE